MSDITHIVSDIFAALDQDDGWDRNLLTLCKAAHLQGLQLEMQQGSTGREISNFRRQAGPDKAEKAIAARRLGNFCAVGRFLDQCAEPGRFYGCSEVRNFLEKTAEKNVTFKQDDFATVCGVLEKKPGERILLIGIYPRDCPFDSEKRIRILSQLAPLIVHALRLSQKINRLEKITATMQSIIGKVSEAIFITDGQRQLLHANAPARILLSNSTLFAERGGRLRALHRNDEARLASAFEALTSNTGPDGNTVYDFIPHDPASRRTAKRVSVQQGQAWITHGRHAPAHSIVVMAHIVSELGLDKIDLLQKGFDLTPSEARLALTLALEGTLESTLTALDITRNTAKTHLRRIFEKTNTRNQVELVRLVIESCMS